MRTARRRMFTARRSLIAAALVVALFLGGWFWGRRSIARWGVHRAFAAAGLEPATFEVRSVGLSTLRVANVSVGAAPWLTAGTVEVTYSLADLLAARVRTIGVREARWTVAVRDGTIEWGPGPRKTGGPLTLDLPFNRLELTDSVIRVVVDGATHDVPITAQLAPSGPGAVTARVDVPASVNWESSDLRGGLGSAAAGLTVRSDGSAVSVVDGTLTVRGGSLRAGDVALSDAHLDAVVRSPDTAEVISLGAIVGDGSTIEAAPFTVDLRAPRVQTRVTVSHVSLAEWLPLLSGGHATGQGRVSGHLDIGIEWTAAGLKMAGLAGSLRADPQHGFIQVADAEALGGLLERQDPRFATDEGMRSVRDKIVAALQDFAFSTLTVDLSRRGNRTIALTHLSGFGRHGDDPQGINLTLDLQVDDAFLDLGSRLAVQSKIRDAAADALDRFFQDGPPPRR